MWQTLRPNLHGGHQDETIDVVEISPLGISFDMPLIPDASAEMQMGWRYTYRCSLAGQPCTMMRYPEVYGPGMVPIPPQEFSPDFFGSAAFGFPPNNPHVGQTWMGTYAPPLIGSIHDVALEFRIVSISEISARIKFFGTGHLGINPNRPDIFNSSSPNSDARPRISERARWSGFMVVRNGIIYQKDTNMRLIFNGKRQLVGYSERLVSDE